MKDRKEYFKKYYQKNKKAYKIRNEKRYKPKEREKIIDIEGEEWRDIKGYEGKYQVSNKGRVKTLLHRMPFLLAQSEKNGYKHVMLVGWKGYTVHFLVAQAFIPNPNNYNAVHHKNHNRSDNRVENLEWMDRGEHQAMHNRERDGNRILVDRIDKITGEILGTYRSMMDAVAEGYHQGSISLCCNGKLKTHKKFIWKGHL